MTTRPDQILDALSTGFICLDGEELIVRANKAFADMVDSSVDALIGARMTDAADYDSNRAYFDALNATLADGQTRRVRSTSLDFGGIYDSVITRVGDLTLVEVIDVTAEVTEHQRRVALEAAKTVVWDRSAEFILAFDLISRTLITSIQVKNSWPIAQLETALREGTMLDALSNPTCWSDPWPDETSLFDGRVERAIAEVFTSGVEQRHRTRTPLAGGHVRYFDTQIVPWDVEGERRGVIIVASDVTRHLRAIRQSAIALEAINEVLDHLPVEIWEFDLGAGRVTPLLGHYDPSTPPPSQPINAVLSRLADNAGPRIWAALDRLTTDTDNGSSIQLRSADGEHWLQVSLRMVPPTEMDRRRRAVVVITDVTGEVAQAEAQSRLGHANHVMRFAQGVAHDFGNVAQVVGGYSEILMQHPEPAIVEQAAIRLASAAQRGVAVSRRIAKIAQVQQAINTPIDLGDAVDAYAPRLQELLGDGIALTTDCMPGTAALAEREQVRSALDNLCENASIAMQGHGSIHVTVEPIIDAGRSYVEICVADDGPGIPAEIAERVFDPFVTGRPDSGTGLGLYLIEEYLHSVGGEVRVASTPAGATFSLLFPAV